MQKTVAITAMLLIKLLITVPTFAQSPEKQPSPTETGEVQDRADPAQRDSELSDVPVADMPTVWFFMGREFWYPNRFNMSEALSEARIHYRKRELRAAQAQIAEAITWLKLAKANAGDKSKAELQAVITELGEIAVRLDGDKSVSAKELDRAFANANLAIARHHLSKANKFAEQSELVIASRRLIAAADHMKNAANSADLTPSPIVGQFRSDYSPFGMVDETLDLTPKQLKADLETLAKELKRLGEKLDQKAN